MTLATITDQRERDKFEENSTGNTAIRSIYEEESIDVAIYKHV